MSLGVGLRYLTWPHVNLLTVCLLVCSVVSAQTVTTGQITGIVLDVTGSVVAGARVRTFDEWGSGRETTCDAGGRFAFNLLAPGTYRLEINSHGFAQAVIKGTVVNITETTTLQVTLKVAEAPGEGVEITAEPELAQNSAARGEVIQSSTLRRLPLATRNFQQLLTLTAGASGSLPNSAQLGRGDTVFNVNGQRAVSNSIVINGVDARSGGIADPVDLAVPAPDALEEFIVQTNLYDASEGRNTGGVVSVVTKSGTASLHGNTYLFLRNDALNANDFFLNRSGTKRPEYKREQYGATLGGPIRKDRAWFFVAYQGTHEINGTSLNNSIATAFVPQNLGSDRSTTALASLAASFDLNKINPTALFLLHAKLPGGSFVIPSAPEPVACTYPNCTSVPVTLAGRSKFDENQFNTNFDLKPSNANRFGVKFFLATSPATQALYNSFGLGNTLPLPGFGADFDLTHRLVSIIDTHGLTARALNEFRFGYSRIGVLSVPEEPFSATQMGISSPLSTQFPGMPTISVTNFFDVGASPYSDNDNATQTYELADTLSWDNGRHSLKFGAEYKRELCDLRFNLYTRGQIVLPGLSGNPAFGGVPGNPTNPFRDFLGGAANLAGLSIIGSGINDRANRAHDIAGFVNDNWRIRPRITLNLGLRYEYFGPFTERDGRYIGFDPDLLVTTPIPPRAPAITSPGVAIKGGFVQAGNAKNPIPGIPAIRDSLVDPVLSNFGPRVGFAVQPVAGTDRFVIRGGYGIYYDRPNARLANSQLANFPYYTLAQVSGAPISNPFANVPAASEFPLKFSDATLFPYGGPPMVLSAQVGSNSCAPSGFTCVGANGLYPDIHNFRIPLVQQYNLGVQYELARNLLLDVAFVGSAGQKLYRLRALNQGVAPGAAGPLSPGLSSLAVQNFGVHVLQSSGNSSYNSLQATVTKRYSSGLQFIAAYTYSHSLDDYSGDPSGTNDATVVPGDEFNLDNWSSSDFDRRHRIVLSGVYDLPKAYDHESRGRRLLLNDWQLAGVLTMQSGTPFSVLTAASAFVQARANLIAGCDPKLGSTVSSRLQKYFKTSCFAPASGTGDFGTAGRNILRGPDQRNLDFSIMKFFPLRAEKKLEVRTEFFNIFNTVNFANPVSTLSSANVGQIVRTSAGSRVIQFAVKFGF